MTSATLPLTEETLYQLHSRGFSLYVKHLYLYLSWVESNFQALKPIHINRFSLKGQNGSDSIHRRYLVDREGSVQYEQGQDLPTGTPLGRVGMTDRTTGPHLHWMLKYSGDWVDPGLVLRAMYEAQ